MSNTASTRIRCAIYTRKSSEEGLEQDFNSLDAQREACAAYVLSQASEGWNLLPEVYDDGGISGGTLERPALQRLLEDVRQGRIDIIVVYKVDRLTRSLLDFARLVEAFDEAEVSFVSVTQSFNTTTSMGRLTLNMLLSFAQFEREVTAERIRDKIAASKAKGMWMGGTPPLGYEPDGKNSLAIVEEHAALIRDIFARYRRLGNVRHVAEELEAEGITTPIRYRRNGSSFGGCTFTRGQLYQILKNPVYRGKIAHKGTIHDGKHPAIVETDSWEYTQMKLADNCRGTRRTREASKSLLAGRLVDEQGKALIPVHTSKPAGHRSAKRRYKYYVTRAAHHDAGANQDPALRIPAKEIEQALAQELAALLTDPLTVIARFNLDVPPHRFEGLVGRLDALREKIAKGSKPAIRQLLIRATIHPDRIGLELSADNLAQMLEVARVTDASGVAHHDAQIRLIRSGTSLRLIDRTGVAAGASGPDPTLAGLLVQARAWWSELAQGETDIATLSRKEAVTASWMTRVVRLAFLAPDVVEAVLAGRTPAHLDGKALLAPGVVAAGWDEQRQALLPG